MAKLPQYTQTKIAQAASPGAALVDTSMGKAVGQFAQGLVDVTRVNTQMQEREARDYTISNQNQTTVALAEEKINLSTTAKVGSEYTDGIKNFIESQKQIAVENAPSTKAGEIATQYYDRLMATQMADAVPVAARMNAENTAQAVQDNIEINYNQVFREPGNYNQSLEQGAAVIASSDIPDNVKEKAINEYQENLLTQKLMGTINQNPKSAVREIEGGEYDSIDSSTLNKLTQTARNQSVALDKQVAANEKKRAEEAKSIETANNARGQSNLEIGVSRGQMGYVEIEKAYDAGVITPAKRTQLIKQMDSQIESKEKANISMVQVSAAIEGGYPLDSKTPEHQDAVDMYYANMDDQTRNNVDSITMLVKNTKVIPSQVETMLNAGMKGSTEQKTQSANLIARLNEVAPEVLSDLPQDTRVSGVSISRLVSAGVGQSTAVDLVNNAMYNTTKEQKDVLKTQLSQKDMTNKIRKGFNSSVDKISPSFFTPDRTVAMNNMEAEFNTAVNDYYMMTHDIDTAMSLATTDISKTWGTTWIDGKERMMKYSPEKMYGNGQKSDWIYEQLGSELKQAGVEGKYTLQADAITARQGKPSYLIMTEKDGVMLPFMVDGQLQRYTPDFSITEQAKEAEKEKVEALEKARLTQSVLNRHGGTMPKPKYYSYGYEVENAN